MLVQSVIVFDEINVYLYEFAIKLLYQDYNIDCVHITSNNHFKRLISRWQRQTINTHMAKLKHLRTLVSCKPASLPLLVVCSTNEESSPI